MPSPRLLRPLWPCSLPRNPLQVRWVADGARDKLHAPRRDAPQTSSSQDEQEAVTRDLRDEASSSRRGWWTSVVDRTSSLFSKTAPPEAGKLSQTSSPEPTTPVPPTELASSHSCNVCGTSFASRKNLRLHALNAPGSLCRPSAFPSRAAAELVKARLKWRGRTRGRKRFTEASETQELPAQTRANGNAEGSSLVRRVVVSTQTRSPVPSRWKLRARGQPGLTMHKHLAGKGARLKGQFRKAGPQNLETQPRVREQYQLVKQHQTAQTRPAVSKKTPLEDQNLGLKQQLQQLVEQVRLLQEKLEPSSSPPTPEHKPQARPRAPPTEVPVKLSKVRLDSTGKLDGPKDLTSHQVLDLAIRRYRRSIKAQISTAKNLETLSSPSARLIADKANERLNHLIKNADQESDGPVLLTLNSWSKAKSDSSIASKKVDRTDLTEASKKREPAAKPRSQTAIRSPEANSASPKDAENPDLQRQYFRFYRVGGHGPEETTLEGVEEHTEFPGKEAWHIPSSSAAYPEEPLLVQQSGSFPFSYSEAPFSRRNRSRTAEVKENFASSSGLGNTEQCAKDADLPYFTVNSDAQLDSKNDGQRYSRQIHAQVRSMSSSEHSSGLASTTHAKESKLQETQATRDNAASSPSAAAVSSELSEQSLLEELFPEATGYVQPYYSGRTPYPKLDLPNSVPVIARKENGKRTSWRERVIESFKNRSEQITALQLNHCSTELTEADFRRLIPKGKHIESWAREGEFYKVIPGRDPLSLERLPFYYLLFETPESALAYQNNVSRLHKLSQLHQPSNVFSAIPPPKGFLEDGEDINVATSSYLLKPAGLQLALNMVMQPYNPALRELIDRGGYKPIVPSETENGVKIWKVLLYIEGYEPSQLDLYYILVQDAYARGILWPFHNEENAVRRLRDIVDLKARLLPISSSNPRAANLNKLEAPSISNLLGLRSGSPEEDAVQVNQMIMNRLYNRWVIEFVEEEAARRFARIWHRKVLNVAKSNKDVTWRDFEEVRVCNTEFLW